MSSAFAEIRRICIFGAGGVGGYFGGRIAEKIEAEKPREHEVYLIARGQHLEAIKNNGLKVITPERTFIARPALATGDVSEIPPPDLILLCVKAYDLEGAVRTLKPRVGPKTIILPLLNGVDIYQRIRSRLKEGIVLPACLYLGTHIQSPGVIDQNGGSGAVICGPDPLHPDYPGESLKAFFRQMGLVLDWRDDPFPAIWEKYIFIAAFGLVSAASGKSLGQIMEDEGLKSRVRSIMQEIAAVAAASSVVLPPDMVEASLAKAHNFSYEARTSYQRDIEAGRQSNEGDLYGGAIIREGARLGIPVPVTGQVYHGTVQGL